jgi:LysM repeat protein
MASDKPDSIERAPAPANAVWINDLMDGSPIQRRVNSALNESLGFPKLATEHLDNLATVASKKGSAQQDLQSPDERVRDPKKVDLAEQDQRPPDERVRPHGDTSWDPYESLQLDGTDLSKFLSQVSDYRGAQIQLKVKPSTYTAKPGDSLERIAEKHLGPAATKEQIAEHVDEIARYNQISKTKEQKLGFHVLQPGEQVRLPGHEKEGGTVFTDSQNTRFTYTTDGKTKIEFKDGTSYIRTPDAEGGHTDVHSGPKPEDRFEIKVRKDGSVENSTGAEKTKPELAAEREKLDHIADSTIGLTKERTQFKEDMKAFEQRAQEQHFDADEVAKTYNEISRVLEAKGTHPMDDRKRVRVALGIMAIAAEPTSNDQGAHNTCNVTVIENRLFTRQPSSAAKLIAGIATTGKYVAADGTTVNLDRNSFSTHGEEANNAPRGTNARNYASQLFDVAAVNLILVKHNEATIPPGDLRYSQERPNNLQDSGERVRDFSTNPSKVIADDPTEAALFNGMIDINSMITGRFEPEAFMSHKDSITPLDNTVTSFDTKEEFETKLAAAKESGSFPIVLGVHADNPPFFNTESHRPLHVDQVLTDGHVVLVTGYDPVKHTVTYDNQWGNSQDHRDDKPVSIDDMFKATKRVSASEWLDRIEQRHSTMTEKQYADDIDSIVKNYTTLWGIQKKGILAGSVDEQDQSAAIDKVHTMLKSINPARANLIRKQLKDFLEHQEDQPVNNTIVPPAAN